MSEQLNKLMDHILPHCQAGIVLGFSGGVDSSLLLAVLSLIREKQPFPVAAVMMCSPFQKEQEWQEAEALANRYSIPLHRLEYDPLSIPEVRKNTRERCYHCKKHFFSGILDFAAGKGMETVFDGTNADDLKVYRPGLKAIRELGICSPLAECGFSKKMIRDLSRELHLSTAEKAAAPCLATRFEYGKELTVKELDLVSEGERVIRSLIPEAVEIRLRLEENKARIEISSDWLPELYKQETTIRRELRTLGFSDLEIDPRGYRSGSFDENITVKKGEVS